jgi:site-specific DNA-methyltransferase (adenine-specific)
VMGILHIVMVRKPFLESTITENCLRHGAGALNIDGCRINPGCVVCGGGNGKANHGGKFGGGADYAGRRPRVEEHNLGRWPANVIHDGSQQVIDLFPESSVTGNRVIKNRVQQDAVLTPFTRGKDAPEYTDSGSAARFFFEVGELKI